MLNRVGMLERIVIAGSRLADKSVVSITEVSSSSPPGVVLASRGSATVTNAGSTGSAGIVAVIAGDVGAVVSIFVSTVVGAAVGADVGAVDVGAMSVAVGNSIVDVVTAEFSETVTGSFAHAEIAREHAKPSTAIRVGITAAKWDRLHASMDCKVDAFNCVIYIILTAIVE